MATIDYEKYANMQTRQLVNALINTEKQEQKIKAQIREKQELIQFLKAKIKESLDKPQFINYTESKAYKVARELEKKFPPQELEQIRQEVKGEIMENSDEL